MPPMAPIKLIMALALLRSGFGVTSGISATAGLRYVPIDTRIHPNTTMNSTFVPADGAAAYRLSKIGNNSIRTTDTNVPYRRNGLRRPILLLQRSEMPPNNGNKKMARTLSAAIIAPDIVSFIAKVLVKINGMMLLYICQKAQMDKNANPTRMVCPVFSFM